MDDELIRAAGEHFARGNAFDENGERESAVREWQEAIRLNPDHAAAHFNLAIAYSEIGRTDLAIERMQDAIRLDPFDTEARRELAEMYFEDDRVQEAINTLRQSLNIVSGDAETAHRLAEIYLDQGTWDQATAALEAGGMLEEDADLWYDLGRAYEGEGRREDAILAYRRALVCHSGHRAAEEALDRMHVPTEEPPDPEETE